MTAGENSESVEAANNEAPPCFFHPSSPATALCLSCSRPVCRECVRREGFMHFCPRCRPAVKRPPEKTEAEERRRRFEGKVIPWAKPLLIFIIPLMFLVSSVPTGYLLESPGPSFGLQRDLRVVGAQTYDSDGDFLLTAVRLKESYLINHILSLLDKNNETIKARDYLGEDLDIKAEDLVNQAVTLLSQNGATVVALREAGKRVEVKELGALVAFVGEKYPAYGIIEPGDVIVSLNGEPVRGAAALGETISSMREGEELRLGLKRLDKPALDALDKESRVSVPDMSVFLQGEEREVTVPVVYVPEQDRSVIGVVLRDYFSYESDIEAQWDLEGVKGPSAGLMMTLTLLDAITPEDLTGGKKVAGTGEIFLDGKVGPIGGLPMKIRAAQREGAEIFLYPRDNQEDLEGVSTTLELYPVESLQEALEALRSLR